MGQLSRKHRKNHSERYDRRQAARLAAHVGNQIGRPIRWHDRMIWRIANLLAPAGGKS